MMMMMIAEDVDVTTRSSKKVSTVQVLLCRSIPLYIWVLLFASIYLSKNSHEVRLYF